MKNNVYYLAMSPINGICNDNFFKGSITIYPTNEKGNLFFKTDFIFNRDEKFYEDYKKFLEYQIFSILKNDKNAHFIFFNDKKKIRDLCSDLKNVRFVYGNNDELLSFLNNKPLVRKWISDIVPVVDNFPVNTKSTFEDVCNQVSDNKFVVQASHGAGGENTILIESENQYLSFLGSPQKLFISKYIKHTPVNITFIIGDFNTISFPISIQLISIDNGKFKYCGGDFSAACSLSINTQNKIINLSKKIAHKIKTLGYRGIIGFDYLVTEDDDVIFCELNPRFQSSSFLLSLMLRDEKRADIAKLHYDAISGNRLEDKELFNTNFSFVNCNNEKTYADLGECHTILNGYFPKNPKSVYRKVFNHSIFGNNQFIGISKHKKLIIEKILNNK